MKSEERCPTGFRSELNRILVQLNAKIDVELNKREDLEIRVQKMENKFTER